MADAPALPLTAIPAPAADPAAPAKPLPPAVATPPVTIKGPEEIAEAIKAKVKESIKPNEPAPKTDDKGKPQIDAKMTRALGDLQKWRRENEPKLKDFDALKTDAETLREFKALWSKDMDSRVAVLGKLAGKEGIDALAEIVADYYKKEQETPPGEVPKPATPEAKAMLDEIKALRAVVEELKGASKANEEKSKGEAFEAQKKGANDYVRRHIDANKANFARVAKPENIDEAIDLAHAGALRIAKRDYGEKQLTNEEADAVYLEALAEVETEFRTTAERFSVAPPVKQPGFDVSKYNLPRKAPPPRLESELRKGASTTEVLEHYRRRAANGDFSR